MSVDPEVEASLDRAAEALASAEALLVGAGAGMGVDSGLPDFRGPEGFWKAYPPYRTLGLDFVSLANPRWFREDPALAWGFYGHRLNLYRRTVPHDGFRVLKSLGEPLPGGAFVFTSNVDGQFQRAGFPKGRVFEVHGAIGLLQCTRSCGVGIFEAPEGAVDVDEATGRARSPLPACPSCGALARPNILMFGDGEWDEARSAEQEKRFNAWARALPAGKTVVVECGAGTAIPTVRHTCEQVARLTGGTLVRVNLRESGGPKGTVSLPLGCLDALSALERRLTAH